MATNGIRDLALRSADHDAELVLGQPSLLASKFDLNNDGRWDEATTELM